MAVIVTCKCGQSFKAREDLLGKRVACPACNQPLDILHGEAADAARPSAPSKPAAPKSQASKPAAAQPKPKPAPAADDPLGAHDDPLGGLGDAAGFEQSASVATNAAGQIIAPGYAGHGHVDEGFSKGVVIAMWIGGGAVGLMLIAMVITAIIGVGEPDPDTPDSETTTTASAAGEDQAPSDEDAEETDADDAEPARTKKSDRPAEPPAASGDDDADAKPAKPKAKKSSEATAEADSGQKKEEAAPPPKPAGVSVTLSAGTALPQSLAGGTIMMVSVDYRFTKGQPDESVKYLWVVESADGETIKEPVQLKASGNLMTQLPDFRPEQGPFQTYMEDPDGKRIAAPAPLK